MDETVTLLDLGALERRFVERAAAVGVIGLGYVGLPLALAAGSAGFRVLGFDINAARVDELNDGISPLKHIGNAIYPLECLLKADREKRSTTVSGQISEQKIMHSSK